MSGGSSVYRCLQYGPEFYSLEAKNAQRRSDEPHSLL